MTKRMTVSDLSKVLGVSVNTVWKKINRRGLTTVKELVNNREITVVVLSDDEYTDLLSERLQFNPVNNGVNNPDYEDNVTIHEGVKMPESQVELIGLVENIMNYSRDMNSQIKEYVDRVINAEKQVKLLEDLESRKEADYLEITAENKQLEVQVQQLKQQVHEQSEANNALQEKINELEAKNSELKTRIAELEQKGKEYLRERSSLVSKASELETKIAAQNKEEEAKPVKKGWFAFGKK